MYRGPAPPVSPKIGSGWERPSVPIWEEKGNKGMAHITQPHLANGSIDLRGTLALPCRIERDVDKVVC